jgi:hypothetical protein
MISRGVLEEQTLALAHGGSGWAGAGHLINSGRTPFARAASAWSDIC